MNGILEISKDEYHADTTHVSHSAMECFRESVPLYHGRYISKTIPRAESAAFDLGQAFHTFVLEPEKFDSEFAVAPERWKLNTNIGKDSLAKFKIDNPGKSVLWPDDYADVFGMRESIMSNKTACKLVESPGRTEFAIQWVCEETGVACKARFDKLIESEGGAAIILDPKSAADPTPEAWLRAAGDFGYHRQDPWYRWGLHKALGIDARFIFLAVGKKAPYECVLYELTENDTTAGRCQYMRDLRRLRDCRLFNQWGSQYSEIQSGSIPPWNLRDGQ